MKVIYINPVLDRELIRLTWERKTEEQTISTSDKTVIFDLSYFRRIENMRELRVLDRCGYFVPETQQLGSSNLFEIQEYEIYKKDVLGRIEKGV